MGALSFLATPVTFSPAVGPSAYRPRRCSPRCKRWTRPKSIPAPAGASPPASITPRSGVLVFTSPVNGNPEIYVVGADGELHGFATPRQLKADGYDVALIVTGAHLGGFEVGPAAGATLTALATRAGGDRRFRHVLYSRRRPGVRHPDAGGANENPKGEPGGGALWCCDVCRHERGRRQRGLAQRFATGLRHLRWRRLPV